MKDTIKTSTVIKYIRNFVLYNEGDELTEDMILSLGSAILDVSYSQMAMLIKCEELDAWYDRRISNPEEALK